MLLTIFDLIALGAAALFLIVLLFELIVSGPSRRWALQLGLFLAGAVGLFLVLRLGGSSHRQAFGQGQEYALIAVVFVCILLGMAARYVFYLRGKFKWRSFLKPFLISPMVFFPLLGTIPFGNQIEPIQWISFALLAFQNGFFWRVVFERAKKSV